MRLCTFETMNLSVPMLDIGGTLYTSSAVLAETFGIDGSAIRHCVRRNKERFSGVTIGDVLSSVTDCHRKELQSILGVQRLRRDIVLWSHRDLIHLGLLLTGETARAFQEDVITLIERQARVNYVPREVHEKLIIDHSNLANEYGKVVSFCESLQDRMSDLESCVRGMATNAGRSLRLVKT